MCRFRISSADDVEKAHSTSIEGASPLAHCRGQWSTLLRSSRNDPAELRRAEVDGLIQRYASAGREDELTRTTMLAKARKALEDLVKVHERDGETSNAGCGLN